MVTRMEPAKPRRKAERSYSKHGLTRQKAAFNKRGVHALDGRTKAARELLRWRAELVADLGGEETISTQQQAVVDLAVRTKLLLDSVDAWLLQQPSLVNKRKKALLPVVSQRQALADALSRYMGQLGLERKAKPVPSLTAYLEAKRRDVGSTGGSGRVD